MKYVKSLNEAVRYVDRAGKPFNIKGINFNSNYYLNDLLSVNINCNYIVGLMFDNRPLAHNAKIELNYSIHKHSISFFLFSPGSPC